MKRINDAFKRRRMTLHNDEEKNSFQKSFEMSNMTLEIFLKATTNSCNRVLLSGNLNTPTAWMRNSA